MPDEERSEWSVWFPAMATVEIAGKQVLIRELSWEQIEKCSRWLGSVASDLMTVKRKLNLADVGDAVAMGKKLFAEIPAAAKKLIEIGSDVPVEVLDKSAAKVVPKILTEIFRKNTELKDSFFELTDTVGVKLKKAEKTEK